MRTTDSVLSETPTDLSAETMQILRQKWQIVAAITVVATAIGYGSSYLLPPGYTTRASILPPQTGGTANAALQTIGALAGLAGLGSGVKNPIDQFVSLLSSDTVLNGVIKKNKLDAVYETDLPSDSRKRLSSYTKIQSGKDGLISIEVEDRDPHRSVEIVNSYIEEFRSLLGRLAITEAASRRVFFESQLKETKNNLTKAEIDLGSSGINVASLKTRPEAAVTELATLRAQLTDIQIRSSVLSQQQSMQSPELLALRAEEAAIKQQIARAEQKESKPESADYVRVYREFRYQETLFELLAKQYELARVDEARQAPLVQIVDEPQLPDRKSKPRHLLIAAAVGFATLVAQVLMTMREANRKSLPIA